MLRTLFLATLLLLSLFLLPAQAEDILEIHDLSGLLAIQEQPGATYSLAANINLDDVSWEPFPFSGTFYGNGYTLYNLHITQEGDDHRVTRDGNLNEYDTGFAGLFSVMENATVTDLHFLGVQLEIRNASHCYAGTLAGYMDHCTVSGCSVDGRIRMISRGRNAGIGGLVGYGCGTFSECTANVEMVYEDEYQGGRCEMFLGGLLGCGIVDLLDNTVDIDGYNSCHGYMHAGGLVGMYYPCGMDYPRGEMIRNTVRGRIIFFEDNPDRRSYVRAYIGEPLQTPAREYGNKDSFRRPAVWDYSKVLSPEACDEPSYVVEIVDPTEDGWGYTLHTCTVCGYSFKDHYIVSGEPRQDFPEIQPTQVPKTTTRITIN